MRGEMKSRYTAGQRVGTVAVCLVLMLLLSFWLFYEPDHGRLDPSEEQARAVADSLLSADVTRFRDGLRTYAPYTSDSTAAYHRGQPQHQAAAPSPEQFLFDPNTADSAALVSLGFRPFVARNIVRYRLAGGRFRNPDDLLRIYGIDSARVMELYSYIAIAPTAPADTTPHRRKDALPDGYTVDLNSADTAELMRVPRIGSVRAGQIVRYRKRLGGYTSVSQIAEACANMDSTEFSLAAAHLRAEVDSVRKIHVNRSSVERLDRHPYISFYQARALYEYRWNKGGCIDSIGELLALPEFTPADVTRLAPYLDFTCPTPGKRHGRR